MKMGKGYSKKSMSGKVSYNKKGSGGDKGASNGIPSKSGKFGKGYAGANVKGSKAKEFC